MNSVLLRIRHLLDEKGASENAFTKEIGIAQSTYNTWVQKDRVPSAKWLPAIADYFEVSIDYLMHGVADSESPMTDDAKKMYEKFAKLLDTKGVSAYKVSKETGIDKTTFSKWKSGAYTPKVDKLKKIAEYFGVPVSYFYDDNSDDVVLSSVEKKLLGLFGELSTEGQELLLERASELVKLGYIKSNETGMVEEA